MKSKSLKETTWRLILRFITFFYHKSFQRNTVSAIQQIIHSDPDSPELPKRIKRFAASKSEESKYVQIAAAIVVTAVSSALSWTSVTDAHWSVFACFYSSILIALVAVALGAQQQWVLPIPIEDEDIAASAAQIQALLIDGRKSRKSVERSSDGRNIRSGSGSTSADHEHGDQIRESKSMLFALQCPMMLFVLSIMTFLAGLWAIVFSPLAHSDEAWGDLEKIAAFFGVMNLLVFVLFYWCSIEVHRLDGDQKNAEEKEDVVGNVEVNTDESISPA